jgi:hypothetical protein
MHEAELAISKAYRRTYSLARMEKVRPVRPKAQPGPDYEFPGPFTLDWGFQSSGK